LGRSGAGRPCAVFDIDGVVADVRHRLHHVARTPKNWRGFFAGAGADPPLETGIALARRYAADHDLVWLTGRPQHLRGVTERWLRGHDLPDRPLVMRPRGDFRPARAFKAEAVAAIGARQPVVVVVDDDPEVVAALRAGGWPVQLADWVPRQEALRRAQEDDGHT
jgi:hypothetical protein